MNIKQTAEELKRLLELYAIEPDEKEVPAILIYASMLVGKLL